MAHLAPVLRQTFFDSNGRPLANGKLYTYAAGTSTPLVTYKNKGESSQNTNPIILDSSGQCNLWLGANAYKLILTTALDVPIWTQDNVTFVNNDTITKDKLASDVPGIGMSQALDGSLDVNVDNESIEVDEDDNLSVKAGGIGTEELADDSVTSEKLASDIDLLSKLSDVVEVVFTQPSDFNPGQAIRGVVQWPWSAPTKLTDPSTLPTGNGKGAAWSPSGEFLAVAHATSPYITIYQKFSYGLVKLADPSSLPASTANGVSWSPNGDLLAVVHNSSPFITIYQRNGSAFTKLSDPGTLPASHGLSVCFSPNGEFLIVGHVTTPFITIYQVTWTRLTMDSYTPAGTNNGASPPIFSGTPAVLTGKVLYPTFTKLSNPASLPTAQVQGVAFSPNGEFLVAAHIAGGGADERTITIYQKSSLNTFTKLTDPSGRFDSYGYCVAWSPDSQFIAYGCADTPYIIIYQRSGTTFTKLSNPANIPSNQVNGVAWSPNGKYVACAHNDTPYITIYERSNTTFTKLTNPSDLPAGNGNGLAFSQNGKYLAIGHDISPRVHVMQTASTLPTNGILYAREIFHG